MKKFGYIDNDGVVLTKGRVACEIDIVDEFLVIEFMFNGVFVGLSFYEFVVLVLCFMFVEKSNILNMDKFVKAFAKSFKVF